MQQMSHRERVVAALKGAETDRTPISMWRHFFDKETAAETLAEAMLGFQRQFDWDFMKVNPRASYHVEGWGVKASYHGAEHPRVVEFPVNHPADWLKLKVLPIDTGVLKEQLDALDIIARGLHDQVPFLMTVFTPVAIAGRMTPTVDLFMEDLRDHRHEVDYALEVITETFTAFSRACLDRGAWGLFYATTHFATSRIMSSAEYKTLVRPYDLKLLNALPPARFNVMHVCEDDNLIHEMADYPVHAFSWDALGHGNLSMARGRKLLQGKAVIGGISHRRELVRFSPDELNVRVTDLKAEMGGTGWMLGPGCTFPAETPEENIKAIRQAA
jgi:uroporphyrinogen decarboxylase